MRGFQLRSPYASMARLSMVAYKWEWTCLYIPTFGSDGRGEVPQDADKQILACTDAGPLFVHRTFTDCSRLRVKLRRASTPFAVRTWSVQAVRSLFESEQPAV